MATKIKSEESAWQTTATRWNSGEVSSIADDFTAAYHAAMRVKDAARTIGRDIGLNVYLSEIGELRRRQQIMAETTSDIHLEVDELVDNPFARELSNLLENAYALNPSDITVNTTGPFGYAVIQRLDMLLSGMVANVDPALKADFDRKVKNLDEDFIKGDLARVMLNAFISNAERAEVIGIEPDRDVMQKIVDLIAALNIGVDPNLALVSDKENLVKYYELLIPEHGVIMNDFLKPLAKDVLPLTEDILNIKFLSYKAEEPFKTIMFYYLPEINIIDHNWKGTQHYHPETKGKYDCGHPNRTVALFFGQENGKDDPRGPYFVFFHEIGHGIDDMMKLDGIFDRSTSGLQDILRSDLYNNMKTEITRIINREGITLGEKQINDIIYSFAVGGTTITSGSNEEIIKNFLITDMRRSVSGHGKSTISDVVGGYTNNLICDYYHPLVESDGVTPTYYWTDAVGNETGAQSSELFAGYFSANTTGYEIQKSAIDDFFKNGSGFLDTELAKVASSLEGN